MKKWTVLIALIACKIGFSQVVQRNLLTNKYSLQEVAASVVPIESFKPFPKSSAEWKSAVSDSLRTLLISDGEANLKKGFSSVPISTILEFKRNGNRSKYEGVSFIKRNRLVQLAVAESIEGKGRFLDAIMDGVWSICEESYWGVPAHITDTKGIPDVEKPSVDLFTAETASSLALVNYFVGDKLETVSPLFHKRLVYELNKRFYKPLAEHFETYGYLKKDIKVNNWNPWIMSNYITTILLVEQDKAKRGAMLLHAMQGVQRYFNGLGNNGGCDEGAHYWSAAGASAFDCLEWLKMGTNGKVDIFTEPLIQKMLAYIYKVHIGGAYFVNVGDGEPEIDNLNGPFLHRIGKTVNDEQMKQFALWANVFYPKKYSIDGFSKMRTIKNLLDIIQLPKQSSTYKEPQNVWIDDVQLMTARSADQSLFLGTHAGNNGESHNHNDVGDFVIYVNSQPFIIDAGRSTYTAKTFSAQRYELWNMQSQYHNLPTINGKGQGAGKDFTASNVVNSHTDTEDKLSMNIAAAYPKQLGIKTWNRTNTLFTQKNTIQVTDDYELAEKPTSLQQCFLTVAKVDTTTKGKIILIGDKDKLVIQYNPSQVDISTDLPQTDGTEYERIGSSWHHKTITRIVFTHKAPKAKGKLMYQFIKE